MRFIRAEIYGFGRWVDKAFDFESQALISLYGKNESGKSTLQAFIMYMLFGLPPRQLTHFKPRNSNKIGGKLTIEDAAEELFTIERVGSKVDCLLADGSREDEAWLEKQLNGLTREIYSAIYAFSALDLEKIRSMKETDVSDVLFSVGLTGAANIKTVERQLDTRIGDLFKKTGKRPQINEQLAEVEVLQKKVNEFQANEASYRSKQIKKERLMEELNLCQQELDLAEGQLRIYENIQQNLPTIEDYYLAEDTLSVMPDNLRFPEQGEARQERIKEKLIPLEADYHSLTNKHKELEEKYTNLTKKLLSEHAIDLGQEIVAEKQAVMEGAYGLKQLADTLRDQQNELNDRLAEIELSESYVAELSLPFQLEAKWGEIAIMASSLSREKEDLLENERVLRNEQTRTSKRHEEIKATQMDPDELEHMRSQVNAYEVGVHQQNEQEKHRQQLADLREKNQKTMRLVPIGVGVLALISIILFFMTEQYLFLGVGGLLLIFGGIQFYHTSNTMKQMEAIYGGENSGSNTQIITSHMYEEYKKILAEQADIQTTLQHVTHDLEGMKNEYLTWQDKMTVHQQKEHRLKEKITDQGVTYPFLQQMEPVHWGEYLQLITKAKRLVHEKRLGLEKQSQLLKEAGEFEEKLQRFAEYVGLDEAEVTLEKVDEILVQDKQNRMLYEQEVENLRENRLAISQVVEQIKRYQREEKELFDYANVGTVEAYLQVAQRIEKRNDLVLEQEKAANQIRMIFPEEMADKILNREINLGDLAYYREEYAEQVAVKTDLQQELNEALAKVKVEIDLMESSDAYSEAQFRLQLEVDKLNEKAVDWAKLKLVQTVLAKAKHSYQEKYLGEVMKITTDYFKLLTDGAYVQVYAPKGREFFQVETAEFDTFTVAELSQGTIDQLYIALRLAISKVMSEKYAIPLIIDDAFVHFDDERRGQGVNLLNLIAKEQQVFLFTCHRHLALATGAIDINKGIRVGA